MFRSCARISVALLLLPVAAAAAGNVVPLTDAVKQHDLDTVRALLQQHVDVNASEADGSTALHWAAHHGDFDEGPSTCCSARAPTPLWAITTE